MLPLGRPRLPPPRPPFFSLAPFPLPNLLHGTQTARGFIVHGDTACNFHACIRLSSSGGERGKRRTYDQGNAPTHPLSGQGYPLTRASQLVWMPGAWPLFVSGAQPVAGRGGSSPEMVALPQSSSGPWVEILDGSDDRGGLDVESRVVDMATTSRVDAHREPARRGNQIGREQGANAISGPCLERKAWARRHPMIPQRKHWLSISGRRNQTATGPGDTSAADGATRPAAAIYRPESLLSDRCRLPILDRHGRS